jgi:hypothetical protein
LFTENICSGNKKIRDESHETQILSSVTLSISKIPREEPTLPTNTISQKSKDNLVLQ